MVKIHRMNVHKLYTTKKKYKNKEKNDQNK